jgi:hypothetical protein
MLLNKLWRCASMINVCLVSIRCSYARCPTDPNSHPGLSSGKRVHNFQNGYHWFLSVHSARHSLLRIRTEPLNVECNGSIMFVQYLQLYHACTRLSRVTQRVDDSRLDLMSNRALRWHPFINDRMMWPPVHDERSKYHMWTCKHTNVKHST